MYTLRSATTDSLLRQRPFGRVFAQIVEQILRTAQRHDVAEHVLPDIGQREPRKQIALPRRHAAGIGTTHWPRARSR